MNYAIKTPDESALGKKNSRTKAYSQWIITARPVEKIKEKNPRTKAYT